MRKDIAQKLKRRAKEIAKMYSLEARDKNTNNEVFSIYKIKPLSEFTAVVIFEKYPTNKRALIFCYWINMGDGHWAYFFPTDSHILGMRYVEKIKQEVEEFNYDKN